MSKIPLVDLHAQYINHQEEFDAAIKKCIHSSSFIGGDDHRAFAEEFEDFCGGGHVALCGNGTDALALAILELLGQGHESEEIITVSHTFIATAEAITQVGYTPVFVDIHPDTCLMNVDLLEEAITPRTKAIIPVHLYGQMVPMDAVMEIAKRYGLAVIEDAAQAHGAKWQGRGPGHWGDAACFSFYPGKNLGAWGDGGAVFSRDQGLIERLRMRTNHGRKAKYEHEFVGVNSRLDGLQAAILRVKLRHLNDWNAKRRQVAVWYHQLLGGLNHIKLPSIAEDAEHVFHLYVVQVEDRDRVYAFLHEQGVGAGIHYPIPLHEQPAYAYLKVPSKSLPETDKIACRIISLPIYPEMRREQVEAVVYTLRNGIVREK
jgi:dTDP-4-amino-4,6-dideoxygalactose transaminase